MTDLRSNLPAPDPRHLVSAVRMDGPYGLRLDDADPASVIAYGLSDLGVEFFARITVAAVRRADQEWTAPLAFDRTVVVDGVTWRITGAETGEDNVTVYRDGVQVWCSTVEAAYVWGYAAGFVDMIGALTVPKPFWNGRLD